MSESESNDRVTDISDIHFSATDVAKFVGFLIVVFGVYLTINDRVTRVEIKQDTQGALLAQTTAEQRLLEKRFNTEVPALMTTFRSELRSELKTVSADVNWIRQKLVEWKPTK